MIKRGMLILLLISILAFSVNAMIVELVGPTPSGIEYQDVNSKEVTCKVTKNETEEITSLTVWYEENATLSWQAGSTKNNPDDNTPIPFSLTNLINATYTWNCLALNNESNAQFAGSNLTFKITFTTAAPPPTNQAPALLSNIPDMIWPEDTVNNSLNLSVYFNDPDKDPLTFSVSTIPSNIGVSISTDIVTFTPNANWTGSTSVKFSAFDGTASTESNSVSITITPVNDPPLLVKEIPNLTWIENNNKKIDLDDYFSDVDGESLNFTFTSVSNINVSIDDEDHDATFIPDDDWTGSRVFKFTALDSSNATAESNEFTLKVEEGAEEPEDTMILTKSPTDEDVNMSVGESKTFSITKQPSNATVKWYVDNLLQTNETEDSFVYKPTKEGSYNIRVQIVVGGTSDDHQWTVTVSAAGAATTPAPKAAELKEVEAEEKEIACGNRECEEGEDQFSCCLDCGCPEGYTCNEQTKTCRREKEAGNLILIIIVVSLFVGGAVGGYFYYKKKQEKEIFGLANEPIEVPPLKKEKLEVKKEAKPAEKKPVTAEKPVKKAKTTNQILLKNYILTNLRKGKSFEEIKKTLLKVGWTEEQIQEAYTAAELDKAFS